MDPRARQRLVDEHLSLARALAAQIARQVGGHVDARDLESYGVQGLLEAAERFDDRRGATFATFAYYRARGAIYDGIRRMAQLPRSVQARARAAERAGEYLANLAERDRGAAEQAAPSPSVEDDVRALVRALSGAATAYVTSLEALSDKGLEVADCGPSAEEAAAGRQLGARLRAAIATLPERERHFVEKHYFEGKTLAEAGEELGLSKSWASRLHARAVELLRARLGEDA